MKKVVLAYSGGLDTSISINWLKENYGAEVIAALVDVGQPDDLRKASGRALELGALKSEVVDAKDEFVTNYVFPAIKANLYYEKKYPLATALARPLIAKKLVEIAEREDADYVAHGCTAKGNDQVRFDVGIRTLNPELKIIAPQREWNISRDEAIEYAKKNNLKITVTKKSPYSIDENLWGRSIECGVLEDPYSEPPEDIYKWTEIKKKKSDTSYLEIGFEKGIPVSLGGKNLDPVEIIKRINDTAGPYGVGREDMVENRLVGIKSREIYESRAATVLIEAHRELEALVLDRELVHYKYLLEEKLAELTYYGLWFTPLKSCLAKFVEESQKYVTGSVKVKLGYKNFSVVGRKSPHSMYDMGLATYDKQDKFDPRHSESFIKLWGYPYELLGRKGRIDE
ncbi:MAG: argininosuccinate synthase [Candidatus Humimicrobiaceae bacterium]